MPKAYWITCYREIKDPAKVAAYAKLAGAGAGAVRRALSLPRHRQRDLRGRAEGARGGDGMAERRGRGRRP